VNVEITKAAADAYLLLFQQLTCFPEDFQSDLRSVVEVMMTFKTESTGIEGVDLVLPNQRLDEICRQLLNFSSGTEKNDSSIAAQYFAIRCITKLASRDRYCVASLERVSARGLLETIGSEGSEKDVVLPALITCALDEIQKQHIQELPKWQNVSQIDFKDPRTYAALLRAGDSREPDQHWFAGRRRFEGLYQFGRISWNHQQDTLKVPAHPLDIQLRQITNDSNTGNPNACEVLMGRASIVRWLDVPVGKPFSLDVEHSPFIGGAGTAGEEKKDACIAIFTVPGSHYRWNPGYIQEGMTQAQQDWSFGLGGSPKCTAMKVLVSAF